MTALAWFCTLRHFDLNLVGTDKITAGHTETAGGYLLDRRTAVMLHSFGIQAVVAFTALTGI